MSEDQKYWGMYRGTVSKNNDPEHRGRIQVVVPDVTGTEDSTWALPCVPYAGENQGESLGIFFIPPEKALVWVGFEHGDRDFPVWMGCFYDTGKIGPLQGIPELKVLKTAETTITLSDQQGSSGITIETKNGMKLVMNSKGIEITNGKAAIKLSDKKVSINGTALEVE